MGRLSKNDRKWLEARFGGLVNFDPYERLLYGRDIAIMPSLIKPVIGQTVPDAVVQPESESELVEPGITWEQLDRRLKPQGLTLRLYPTSYPSSSAGGWMAQGGAGIGSFEFGWFAENVVRARVVLPSSEVREVSGPDLDLIADAEGTTGIISQVTLRVQKISQLGLTAIACPDAHKLTQIFQSFVERGLPLWSVIFINPRMAEMKNRAPVRTHQGHPAEHKVILPAAYIAVLAYREADRQKILSVLPEILHPCQGEVLNQAIAEHEWENRFKLMVVKRLGPSLVPAEVVVPLDRLGEVMEEIESKVNQPVVKEGVVVKKGKDGRPEVVILGFIPSDQRKFSHNFVFGLVLTILKIAEKHGGRPYSTGLYFTGKIKEIMGKDRAAKLKKFKKQVDRRGILNPGKVTGGKTIGTLLNIAGTFEPLVRPFGNNVATQIGERRNPPVRGIPPDVAWYAYGCSQCGYCVDECDQFYGRGWESQSPRGKWYWLREFMEGRVDWNQKMVDTFLVCTTCELCNLRCSAALPIEPSWMELRGKLVHEDKKMTFPPFEMMAAATRAEGNIWAGYRKDRTHWFPQELREKHDPGAKSKNVYFAGCTVSYVENDIGQAAVTLLDAADVDFTYLGNVENCCGSVLTLIKEPLVAHDIGQTRLEEATAVQAETVLALCPCCEFQLRVSKEKKNTPIEVRDLAAFACQGLGKSFADPGAEVSRQWKVFEGMIALMSPQGFAGLMDTMWPELLRAMPLGMGGMMKGIGKLGPVGGLLFAMMKPVFPVLFPRLLPGMMPKVMPTMLERTDAMISMPDYMREQMPDMMPKIMDNLMPHMLPDVVPLAVPKMIAHLRGRA